MIARAARNLRVAGFLASRSLVRGNASVTAMTVLMMAVVFISVVFLPSLINGAVSAIQAQVTNTAASDLTVTSAKDSAISRAPQLLDQVRTVPGVTAATGTRRIGNQVSFGERSNAWGVDAIDPTSYAKVFTTAQHLIEGHWLTPGDAHGIVLGVDVAGADQTRLRGYAGSLQHVHAGDRVEIGLLDGSTATFTVRGIYQNHFVLSDQGAFVTTAAADALQPPADYAATVQQLFDAVDKLNAALAGGQHGAAHLAEANAALSRATGDLADAAGTLADQVQTVSAAGTDLAHGADQLAASSATVANGAAQLSSGISALNDAVRDTLLPGARQAAQDAAAAAQSAAALAASCPSVVAQPSRCAQEAQLAQDSAAVATEVATTATQLTGLSQSLDQLAATAVTLKHGTASLHTAAKDLARGAGSLATGIDALGTGTNRLHTAARTVSTQAEAVAASAKTLAQKLNVGNSGSVDSTSRQQLQDAVDSPRSVPGPGTVTRVFVKAAPDTAPATLEAAIGKLRPDLEFQTAAELTTAIQDQIDSFTLINNIMRVISLMVAAITVFILTYVELTNRRRQIGIERAIGIRAGAIVGSYVLKSAINALIGVAFGLLLYRAVIVPFVERHPFQFPNGAVVLVANPATTRSNVILLLIVAVLAALVPTINTIRMKILDAIWGR